MSWLSSLFKPDKSGQQAAAATAAMQAKQEEDRQQRIREGQGKIDSAFAQFNPDYFSNYQTAFKNNYAPEIGRQYDVAKDKLIATLAGRGTLESTVGAAKFGDLENTRAGALADVGNRAVDASNELKSKVESAKTNLYNLNAGVADPSQAAAAASGAATSLVAPAALSPIGQVFASTLSSLSAVNKADSNSMRPSLPWNQGYWTPSGRGSSLNIG